jgi:hypothetical protein
LASLCFAIHLQNVPAYAEMLFDPRDNWTQGWVLPEQVPSLLEAFQQETNTAFAKIGAHLETGDFIYFW